MRRVVVTGLGIVSSIGNNAEEVLEALKNGTSGIEASPEMAEHGFRSRVAAAARARWRSALSLASGWYLFPHVEIPISTCGNNQERRRARRVQPYGCV